jgi:hypothetical protein
MAQKPRGRPNKGGAKPKGTKSKKRPRKHNPRSQSLTPSSRPTTAARRAAVWGQGAYGAGHYGAKPEVLGGAGGHVANATVIPAGGGVATGSALWERPVEIRDAARALSQEFTAQVEELKRTKPNDPDALAKYDDLVAFLEKMAAGLNNLANALDQAVTKAADGKPEPVFLGTAAAVARQLQLGMMEWLEEYRTTIFDVPIRLGLIGLGLTFVNEISGPYVASLTAYLAKKTSKPRANAPKKKR